MKITPFIILLVTVLNHTAYGQTSKNQSNWKTLTENNYTVKYPDNWELNQSGQLGTSFILFSPLSSEKDKFRENVNLLVQDLTGLNLDLDQYVKLSLDQIKKVTTTPQSIESNRINNNNVRYQKVIYTAKQGTFDLKIEQYYWVENDKAYVLALTCEKIQFEVFKAIGETILNSFETH